MDARQERGMQIAATCRTKKNKLGWKAPSKSGNGSYIVNLDGGEPLCTCPDFEKRHQPCEHIHAVEYVIQKESRPDGSITYTQSIKVRCTQDWPAWQFLQSPQPDSSARSILVPDPVGLPSGLMHAISSYFATSLSTLAPP